MNHLRIPSLGPLLLAGVFTAAALAAGATPPAKTLISANPSTLSVGGTSVITIIGSEDDACSVLEGERVRLIADMGMIIPREVFIDANGEAKATFTAGLRPGFGSVTAVMPGAEPATIPLPIRDAAASVDLRATPSWVPDPEEVTIELVAWVSNALGEPFFGETLVFTCSIAGYFQNGGTMVSDGRGEAREVLIVTPLRDFTIQVSTMSEPPLTSEIKIWVGY